MDKNQALVTELERIIEDHYATRDTKPQRIAQDAENALGMVEFAVQEWKQGQKEALLQIDA